MRTIQHIGILLLVIALLPWGAWTGARFADLPRHAVTAQAPEAAAATVQSTAEVARSKRPCRTGVLPGGCPVDLRLDTTVVLTWPLLHGPAYAPERADLRVGIVPRPVKGPPRTA